MPAKKAAVKDGEDGPEAPNAAEFRILDTILKACTLEDKPKSIDFALIAKQLNFKTVASTKERWRQVCKKNGWYSATGTDPPTSSTGETVATKPPAKQASKTSTPVQSLNQEDITQDAKEEKIKQQEDQVSSPQAVHESPRQKRLFQDYIEDP
ncbi:hypothetical protein Hte_010544 [Hypoxylon texense]